MRCSAITRAGTRCKGLATHGSYCWNHSPETVAARKQRASKGGKSGGNGRPKDGGLIDIAQAIRHTKGLVGRLMTGDTPREIATACFMGLNTLARLLELERKIKEQDELEVRIELLEAQYDRERGYRRHG